MEDRGRIVSTFVWQQEIDNTLGHLSAICSAALWLNNLFMSQAQYTGGWSIIVIILALETGWSICLEMLTSTGGSNEYLPSLQASLITRMHKSLKCPQRRTNHHALVWLMLITNHRWIGQSINPWTTNTQGSNKTCAMWKNNLRNHQWLALPISHVLKCSLFHKKRKSSGAWKSNDSQP